MDSSLPGSSVHGILQAKILEWVDSLLQGNLPNPGTEPRSPALLVDSLSSEPPGKPKVVPNTAYYLYHTIRSVVMPFHLLLMFIIGMFYFS